MNSLGEMLSVRFIPSGVISKAQAMTSAMGKPAAITVTKTFITQPGASKVGNRTEPAWINSHVMTAYATPTL